MNNWQTKIDEIMKIWVHEFTNEDDLYQLVKLSWKQAQAEERKRITQELNDIELFINCLERAYKKKQECFILGNIENIKLSCKKLKAQINSEEKSK